MDNSLTVKRSTHGVKRSAKAVVRAKTTGRVLNITNYAGIYRAGPADRITIIKGGVPAQALVQIAKAMGTPKERLFQTLGLSRATVDRKARAKQALSVDEGQRVVGMAKLLGQVQTMVEQSGEPSGFDAAKWVAQWLDEPSPALGGKRPAEYMDTADGQELVSGLLAKMQSGAYA